MKRYFPLTLAALCLAPVSFAASPPQSNIFNADLSHPDMAMAVDTFQDVCLPFIMHRTELPSEEDHDLHVKILASHDFKRISVKEENIIVSIKPGVWKPAAQNIQNSGPNDDRQTIVMRTGEISMHIGPVVEYGVRYLDGYQNIQNSDVMAILAWSPIPDHKRPAQSCEIHINQTALNSETYRRDFISQDADWIQNRRTDTAFSQCTAQGDELFLFKTSLIKNRMTLSVARNVETHERAKTFAKTHQCQYASLDD